MKRLIAVLLSVIILFTLLCGCKRANSENESRIEQSSTNNHKENLDNASNEEHPYTEHQELIKNEITYDKNSPLRISLPEVGLKNVLVNDYFDREKLCEDTYGQVYLLADDRYGGGRIPADNYLVIETYEKIIVKDVTKYACYFGNINLCDLDGDKDSEIILQETISITGGAGGYLSRVFDFKDGQIIEIFSSIDDNEKDFDTGYSITILKDKKFKIENKYTGYSETFNDVREQPDEYSIYYWYNHETGEPKDIDLWVDSFYQFSPIDIDQDGVYEILCRQYVCLVDHADGLGTAKTILKYNNTTSQFEIMSTEFENDSYYI